MGTGPGHLGLWKRKQSVESTKQDEQVISFELENELLPEVYS
jgi:hypothetical protein